MEQLKEKYKITVYPKDKLGNFDFGWLKTYHHFSFGDYHNPSRTHFGALRVINDDTIRAGTGFDPHPHKDMEIITYVRQGAVLHRDSLGNEGRTGAGDVQVMSAGTGIVHAEYSDPDIDTKLFQIWIFPKVKAVAPRWEQRAFPKEPVQGALTLLVSGDPADVDQGALLIHQDARIHGGVIKAGDTITHPDANRLYLVVSKGNVVVDEKELQEGDGAEIVGQDKVTIHAQSDAEILAIAVPA